MVRMGPVEVREETEVHDEASRDPGALLRTVPLPVHQILDPTYTAAGVEETPDSKHRTSVDELRGRRGRNGRSQRTLLDGFGLQILIDPLGLSIGRQTGGSPD